MFAPSSRLREFLNRDFRPPSRQGDNGPHALQDRSLRAHEMPGSFAIEVLLFLCFIIPGNHLPPPPVRALRRRRPAASVGGAELPDGRDCRPGLCGGPAFPLARARRVEWSGVDRAKYPTIRPQSTLQAADSEGSPRDDIDGVVVCSRKSMKTRTNGLFLFRKQMFSEHQNRPR